jgi:hypothetical protein
VSFASKGFAPSVPLSAVIQFRRDKRDTNINNSPPLSPQAFRVCTIIEIAISGIVSLSR